MTSVQGGTSHAIMMNNSESDYLSIALPRTVLFRLADGCGTAADWERLHLTLRAAAKLADSAGHDRDRRLGDWSDHDHLISSPSSSIPSSPTLHPTSSRASSVIPEPDDCGLFSLHSPLVSSSLTVGYPDLSSSPQSGTKRKRNYPDDEATGHYPDDEAAGNYSGDEATGNYLDDEAAGANRLRGGWGEPNCPRGGNRVPAAPQAPVRGAFDGLFLIDGPHGPEVDSDVEHRQGDGSSHVENSVGSGDQSRGIGLSEYHIEVQENGGQGLRMSKGGGGEEGESEVDNDDDGDYDENGPKAKRRKKGEPKTWKQVARKALARKEAAPLMASLSLMSNSSRQVALRTLVDQLCSHTIDSSSPSFSSSYYNTIENRQQDPLVFVVSRLDELSQNAKVNDFHRLATLMQFALLVDWCVLI